VRSAWRNIKSRNLLLIPLLSLVAACAGPGPKQLSPLSATDELLADSASNAGNHEYIRQLYESRTWVPYSTLSENPVEFGKQAEIPIQHEGVKLLGPSDDAALRSLALKIWMIENAQHTIDVVYYIFKTDLVGQAVLGALCNAVQRGVDVRIMVDSIGSLSLFHNDLRALETCAENAGYMRTVDGQPTPYRARVQAMIFSALTRSISWANRRSHDKLMVMDGAFPNKTAVITGGRNISLSYYGIKEDGSADPAAYRDLEILLRSGPLDNFEEPSVGDTSGIYYTLLFLHRSNKRLQPIYHPNPEDYVFFDDDPYRMEREQAQKSLDRLKSFTEIRQRLDDMPGYMSTGFHDSQVLLAHELANLTNRNVVTNTKKNLEDNPNSIMHLMNKLSDELHPGAGIRIVSPYMFIAKYYDKEGNVVEDGVADTHQWLDEHPRNKLEIITNSVLTSDNFLAQSIIDMDVGPRLLLTPKLEEAWLSGLEKGELNPLVVESEEWTGAINHPQVFLYQTGRLDATMLGQGNREYGKLHAKFIIGGNVGFVGTSNFDYRSRLFNNEMGFFYRNDQVNEDLHQVFDDLKDTSYRWGSPEWLQMRKEVMEIKGMKGWSTRTQRFLFKFMRATGLDWLM
jgi:putative cardiolipin synthase